MWVIRKSPKGGCWQESSRLLHQSGALGKVEHGGHAALLALLPGLPEAALLLARSDREARSAAGARCARGERHLNTPLARRAHLVGGSQAHVLAVGGAGSGLCGTAAAGGARRARRAGGAGGARAGRGGRRRGDGVLRGGGGGRSGRDTARGGEDTAGAPSSSGRGSSSSSGRGHTAGTGARRPRAGADGAGAGSRGQICAAGLRAVAVLDIGARVRVDKVSGLDRAAVRSAKVGDEHVGKGFVVGLVTAGASELDGGALHVEFTVSDLVKPRPGQGALSRGDVVRDGEVVRVRVRRGGGVVSAKVASGVPGGTATLERLDHLPDAVSGGVLIVRDGDLATATTVDTLTLESQRLVGSQSHGRGGPSVGSGRGLAGEVAVGYGSVGSCWLGETDWGSQKHVGVGDSGEAEGHGKCVGEHGGGLLGVLPEFGISFQTSIPQFAVVVTTM